jgi:hypothetical protein
MGDKTDKNTILIVEDEIIVAKDIEQSLHSYNYAVLDIARSGEAALQILEEKTPDLILMDIRLSGSLDGIETAEIINTKYDIPLIYLTAYTDDINLSRAKQTEPYGYLPKPFSENEIHTTIVVALYKHKLAVAQKNSETLLRTTLENIKEGVLTTDPDGRIRFINPTAKLLIAGDEEEYIGKEVKNMFLLTDIRNGRLIEVPDYSQLENSNKPFFSRCIFNSQIGDNEVPVEFSINLMTTDDPLHKGLILLIRNISEEIKIERIESRLAAIVDSSADAILSVNTSGEIISWNQGAEQIFGYKEKEIRNRTISLLNPPFQPDRIGSQFKKVLKGEKVEIFETPVITKDGRTVLVAFSFSKLTDSEGTLNAVSIIGRDVSMHRKLEKEILEISENERKRIGQDLHDSLGQQLTGILLKSRYLASKIDNPEQAQEMVSDIMALLEKSIEQTRSLAKGLVPITLNSEGLKGILEELADYCESIYEIETEFIADELEINDNLISTQLYRIAQEAVNNAYKHGKPDKIVIRLINESGFLILEIRDNGKGFDPVKMKKRGGLGLKIMEYRANMIGANIDIFSPPTGGTCIRCRLSLSSEELARENTG